MLRSPCQVPRNPQILFSSFFQQLSLDVELYSFKVLYLLVCLSVLCMLWGLCPHSHYQIHVTAAQMNLLYIFFQIGLSIHLESTRKHHIKSQEPNFKSRSYVADFRFRQIKFHYFFPCKFPIVSFISLSSRENLLEVGTGNFLASSLSLQNKCVFFFFK